QHQVGVGVEPPGQLVLVVVQVALDGVATAATQGLLVTLWFPPEPLRQLELAAVRYMRDAAGDAQAHYGSGLLVVVVPPAEQGVGPDRRQLGGTPGDLLGRRVRR